MLMIKRLLLLLTLNFCIVSCNAAPSKGSPEVGTATYLRDFDQAAQLSKKSGKPIFAFFQEVPG